MQTIDIKPPHSQLRSLLGILVNPFRLTTLLGTSLPLFAGLLVIPSHSGRVWLIQSLVQLGNFLLIIALIQLGFAVVRWGILDRRSHQTFSSKASLNAELSDRADESNAETTNKDTTSKTEAAPIVTRKFIESPLFPKIIIIVGGLLVMQAIGLADYRAPYSSTALALIFTYITTITIQLSLGSRLKPLVMIALKTVRVATLILASAAFVNGAFILRFTNLLFLLFPLTGILFLEAGVKGAITMKRGHNLSLALSALGVVFATFPPITSFTAILPPGFLIFLGFPLIFDMIQKRSSQAASEESLKLLAHVVNIALFAAALLSERGL